MDRLAGDASPSLAPWESNIYVQYILCIRLVGEQKTDTEVNRTRHLKPKRKYAAAFLTSSQLNTNTHPGAASLRGLT